MEHPGIQKSRLNRIFVKQRHELPIPSQLPTWYRDLGIKLIIEVGKEGAAATTFPHADKQPYLFLTLGRNLGWAATVIFQSLHYHLRKRGASVLLLVNDYELAGLALLCYLLYDHYFDLGFSEARAAVHASFPNIYIPFSLFLSFGGPPFDRPVTDILYLPQ